MSKKKIPTVEEAYAAADELISSYAPNLIKFYEKELPWEVISKVENAQTREVSETSACPYCGEKNSFTYSVYNRPHLACSHCGKEPVDSDKHERDLVLCLADAASGMSFIIRGTVKKEFEIEANHKASLSKVSIQYKNWDGYLMIFLPDYTVYVYTNGKKTSKSIESVARNYSWYSNCDVFSTEAELWDVPFLATEKDVPYADIRQVISELNDVFIQHKPVKAAKPPRYVQFNYTEPKKDFVPFIGRKETYNNVTGVTTYTCRCASCGTLFETETNGNTYSTTVECPCCGNTGELYIQYSAYRGRQALDVEKTSDGFDITLLEGGVNTSLLEMEWEPVCGIKVENKKTSAWNYNNGLWTSASARGGFYASGLTSFYSSDAEVNRVLEDIRDNCRYQKITAIAKIFAAWTKNDVVKDFNVKMLNYVLNGGRFDIKQATPAAMIDITEEFYKILLEEEVYLWDSAIELMKTHPTLDARIMKILVDAVHYNNNKAAEVLESMDAAAVMEFFASNRKGGYLERETIRILDALFVDMVSMNIDPYLPDNLKEAEKRFDLASSISSVWNNARDITSGELMKDRFPGTEAVSPQLTVCNLYGSRYYSVDTAGNISLYETDDKNSIVVTVDKDGNEILP